MSHDLADLWPLIQDTRRKLFAARIKIYNLPLPMKEIAAEFELQEADQVVGSLFYMLENYNADSLSTKHYRTRNAYDNPAIIDRHLNAFLADGLIEQSSNAYSVTEKGRRLYAYVKAFMRPRWTLPNLKFSHVDFERLLGFMRRLSTATFNATEPPTHWATTTRAGQSVHLVEDAPPLEQFDWHIFDLWAYRDDSHLAVWSHHGVTPFAWEALAYLWKQEADSSEKLAEINAYREFSAQEWDGYIRELVEQNWVSRDAVGNYALTTAGKAVRDEAEQLTDTYFYTPWSVLSDAEIAELRGLLMQLRNALEDIAAE